MHTQALAAGNRWAGGCRPATRGTVRGTTRRIIPAQRVLPMRWSVSSVQLAHTVLSTSSHNPSLSLNGGRYLPVPCVGFPVSAARFPRTTFGSGWSAPRVGAS